MKLQYIKPSLTTVEVEMHERLLYGSPLNGSSLAEVPDGSGDETGTMEQFINPIGVMIPRQTKVTCSPLGKPHLLFLSLGKPRQKTMLPFWGASFFLSVGRRPVGAASFASLAHVPVHLQRRDAPCAARKGNCGKKREVLRRSRTPSPSAAHRARHRQAPKATDHGVFVHLRARARARASSVFCFLPSLLHLSCNFFVFSWLRTKKR